MGMISGLLTGFTARKQEYEAEQLREHQLSSEREARVFEALLNSPDPEIQAMAATGLLQTTQPGTPQKGLRGWMGQIAGHPAYGSILNLIKTPTETTETRTTLPSRDLPTATAPAPPPVGVSPDPEATPSMAMPETAITSPNAPPPPAPRIYHGGTPYAQKVLKPRQVFQTRAGQLAEDARARGQADIEGEVAGLISVGFSDKEARDLIKQRLQRVASGLAEGNVHQDAAGNWVQDLYDRTTGALVRQIPALDPALSRASSRFVTLQDPAGKAAIYRVLPDNTKQFVGFRPDTSTGEMTEARAWSLAAQLLANQSGVEAQDVERLKSELLTASGARPAPQAAPAAPGAIPGSITLPETPPPGVAPPPPPAGVQGPSAAAPAAPASGLATTGTWQVGKGDTPQSAQAKTVLENLGSLENAIDATIAKMTASGLDKQTDPGATAAFFKPYLMGQAQTNDASGIAQLVNFTRIVGATPYMRGTRAIKWVEEIQQHLPRFPKDTWRAGLVGSALNSVGAGGYSSAASELLGGSGYDSPALIIQKLREVREQIIPAVKAAVLETEPPPRQQDRTAGTPPPAPKGTDTKAGPRNMFTDANGDLHYDSPTGPLVYPKK